MNDGLDYAELRRSVDRGELRKGEIWTQVERAARLGDAEASFTLGYRYLVGGGPEHRKVRSWLVQATERGHAQALECLAEVDRIRWAKRQELLEAARVGDPEAQLSYASLVSANWDELGADLEAGRFWYGKAAEQGSQVAQYEVGLMLLNGEGGPVNVEEGCLWLNRSAQSGFEDAARFLAQFYEDGLAGIAPDPERAAFWRERSGQ